MLLFDLSGMITTACISMHNDKNPTVTIHDFRCAALSLLLRYKKQFKVKYGTPIICVDRKPYWRDDYFDLYKKNRILARNESNVDWVTFSKHMKQFIKEMPTALSYHHISVARAEADDVISVLATKYAENEQVMIISSDKDMLQLQVNQPNIKQWSLRRNEPISIDDNGYDLVSHVIKGDRSDGIPNIFSADDVLMEKGNRQRPITKKVISEVKSPGFFKNNPIVYEKMKRNHILIDTRCIPKDIQDEILKSYQNQLDNPAKCNMKQYIRQHKLTNLKPFIMEF